MAIRMKNKKAEAPRDFIPVAPSAVFDKFWEPGAKALGLELVPLFHNMVISTENQTTDLLPKLIDTPAASRPGALGASGLVELAVERPEFTGSLVAGAPPPRATLVPWTGKV